MSNMINLGIIMVICSLLFGSSAIANPCSDQPLDAIMNNDAEEDKAEETSISGLPVITLSEEEKTDFLERIEWKSLPIDTPMSGFILGFSCDETSDRCVVVLNHVFVFEKQYCKACYSFYSSGSYTVFSEDGAFYVLFHRGGSILQFDENQASVLYKIKNKELHSDEYAKMSKLCLNGTSKSVQSGDYIISNQHPPMKPFISATYDTLIWKDQVVYETSLRLYLVFVVAMINIIAAFILVKILRERRVKEDVTTQ